MELSPPPQLTADFALFLDFDGTLVDLAATPSLVRVADTLPALLRHVVRSLDGAVAIVTGRPIAVIDGLLSHAIPLVAGLHGAEVRDGRRHTARIMASPEAIQVARSVLGAFGRANPEILLEDKGTSIALHFRDTPRLRDACRNAIDDCIRRTDGELDRVDGVYVTEIKPATVSKVRAIETFMRKSPFIGRRPIFIGDDISDEPAFDCAGRLRGYGIVVGDRSPTLAKSRLPSVTDVHQWLLAFAMSRGP
jgi:trehalose 6-phosphate phosphatase